MVLVIYSLANFDAVPAQHYLATAAQKRKWRPKTDEELRELIEDLFLRKDEQELAAEADMEDPSEQELPILKEAVRFLEEWRLAAWVLELNYSAGVPPPTETVLQRYELARSQLPEPVRPRPVGDVTQNKAREWARRWRQRWGARHGSLPVREDISPVEAREKASI